MLTGWAMAVAAGAINNMEMAAPFTFKNSDACILSVALHYTVYGFAVLLGDVVAETIEVFRPEDAEDLIYRSHGSILSWSG